MGGTSVGPHRDGAVHLRELLLIFAPSIALAVAGIWLTYQFVPAAPPKVLKMTTGPRSGAYHQFAQRYAEILARKDTKIKLELVTSRGSGENLERLRDAKSGFQVALIQGGIVTMAAASDLASLGRVYYEPFWVFYRGDATFTRLSDLRGKHIAIGADGSGTRALALKLFGSAKVTPDNSQFSGADVETAVAQLITGRIDAMVIVAGASSKTVQKLLREPSIKLMSESQADALIRLHGSLGKVVLPAGAIDLADGLPAHDVVMVAPEAALVVRKDLHPAIVSLLVAAAKEVHSAPGLFQKRGEFPLPSDPEIPMSDEAAYAYEHGPTLLQRHLPFWIADFIERSVILIIPIVTILLPMFRFAPALYRWRVRRRVWRWYRYLKRLEGKLPGADGEARRALRAEIDSLAQSVSAVPIPTRYASELYQLREHIQLVRQRIAAR